jgi:hypothetical protein
LLSAKEIAPGKSGQIEVKVDTKYMEGAIEKFVYVNTNDRRNPDITLSLKAVVEPEIVLSDSIIFFDAAPSGKPTTKEILLSIAPGKSVQILGVRSDDPALTATLNPAPGSGATKYRLIAVRKAAVNPTYHAENIIIKTTSRYLPEITIPAYVR